MTTLPGTVAILGLGLMGGSLARALRSLRRPPRIAAWTPDGREPAEALAEGVIDVAAASPADAVTRADLIVLAAPVEASVALFGAVARSAPSDAILTDVCSVKVPLAAAARAAGVAPRFAGSHPMCGSHASGWEAARADLYAGARVWVVPAGEETATRHVEIFWAALDARPERTAAPAHDELMARVSHGPQVIASALAGALRDAGVSRDALGPGGRDMTRLAASDPDLWTDILLHNRAAVQEALADLDAALGRFTEVLAAGDASTLRALLAGGRAWATPDRP